MAINKQNKIFKFPFDINPNVFLILAIIFFILSTKKVSNLIFPEISPHYIIEKIENDIYSKIDYFKYELKNKSIINKALNQTLNKEEQNYLLNSPIQFQLLSNNEIKYWNTKNIDALTNSNLPDDSCYYYNDKSTHYVLYSQTIDSIHQSKAILIIPIKKDYYTSDNQYINLIYAIPKKINILANFVKYNSNNNKNLLPIQYNKQDVFYIEVLKDNLNKNSDDYSGLWGKALIFIFFGISLHTYFKVMVKNKKPIYIFIALVLSIFLIRLSAYKFNFLIDFSEYNLFNPETFANDAINKSIGDLLINMCLTFWAFLFFSINVQGKVTKISNKNIQIVFSIIVITIGCLIIKQFINIIYGLVFDSIINFDITLISKINLQTIIAYVIVLIISANIFIVCLICNNYIKNSLKNNYIKYSTILVLISIAFILVPNKYGINHLLFIPLIWGVFALVDFSFPRVKFEINSFYLNIWFVSISTLSALILLTLIIKKDRDYKDFIADNLVEEKDIQVEFKLNKIYHQIQNDKELVNKIINNESYHHISSYIYINYFSGLENKNNIGIYVFNKNNQNINILDSISNKDLQDIYSNQDKTISEFNDNIFILSNNTDMQHYIMNISLNDSNVNNGNIFINISKLKYEHFKSIISLTQFPDYPLNNTYNNYSYAIYDNGKLTYQKNNFNIFYSDININKIFNYGKTKTSHSYKNGYDITYKNFPKLNKSIIIAKKASYLDLFISLLAYSFFVYLTTIYLYIFGNIIARSNFNSKRLRNLLSLNLRFKIQVSILLIVLFSFFTIGFLFIKISKNTIVEKTQENLIERTSFIKNQFLDFYQNYQENNKNNDSIDRIKQLTYLINQLSNKYNVTLSLFNPHNGILQYSTQNNLLQKGLLCNLIPQNTYYNLMHYNIEYVINFESMNDVNYIASYFLLNDNTNKHVAIIQIPNILSSFEISKQTSELFITILNISVFVFFIVYILSHFISKSVSNPFRIIVNKFTKINLEEINEPLTWNSNDEIGLLVKQYNRMLKKLENSTKLLTKTERELAWREMAKQVAHEIKNPLTSMKLSIQMLDRAIKNNSPNVKEQAQKVTNTIIEQIEALTIIATDFSMYAKLSDSKKEIIELHELLQNATGMYNDNNNLEFLFHIPNFNIKLLIDKNQLLRVITNIIQNAIQAIPSKQKGFITLDIIKLKDNFVRIAISDNGIGIDEDKKAFLFTPYFTTKSSGSGIGLAMCKDIIEQFGGKISFESETHIGTTFYIDLPIYNPDDLEN